jgi:DNA-binding response OmpR family regulator
MRWDETQKVLANSRLGEKDTSAVFDGPSCVEREMEPHILFADDSPDLRELVQLLLQAAGFRVSTTDSTASALQLAATQRFDALILDHWMPQITGLELCRRIRAFDRDTPILICSGAVTQADKDEAARAGAQSYVVKPFDSTNLIRTLRSLLEVNVEPHS